MKKLFKILAVTGAIIGGAAGAVYLFSKKKSDDFDDFDDEDFEDIFAEDEEDRDYVTLDIDGKKQSEEEAGAATTETESAETPEA